MKLARIGKILPFTLFAILLAVTACTVLAKSPGRIELSTTNFDFGAISNRKAVSQEFTVRNTGQGELSIVGVSTSCGCTTAQIDKQQLAPGETAQLTVTFDPLVHNGATGEFVRVVYVRSDDPDTPEATLTVHVTVVEG
jgi:hypothetical protein